MKKIISMILCVLMLASVAAFAVYAKGEEDYVAPIVGKTASNEQFVVFDFTVEGQAAQGNNTADAQAMWWGKSKRFDCEFDEANSATKLIYTGNDPGWYFTACIPSTLQFNSNEFKYVKVLYKVCDNMESDLFTSRFYFGLADTDPDGDDAAYYQGQWGPEFYADWLDDEGDPAYYQNNGEWNELVVDMSYNAFWEDEDGTKGYISELRYDMTFGMAPEAGDYIEIKYIAILKTPEDAFKFGILDDGSFGFRDIELPTEPEETTVEETTAADTTVADTTAAEEVTTVAAEVTTAAEAATTAAAEATTAAEKEGGCGGFVGTGIVALVAVLGVCVLPKKHD